MKVLGIAGSLRKDSFNRKLLANAVNVAKELGQPVETFDLISIPLYNGDVEAAGMPDAVKEFRDKITEVDALVIATPEYNYSIPGVLKNAIDWASRPPNALNGKIAAIMGATMGGLGTISAQHHLRHVLNILNVMIVPTPFVMVSTAQNGAFDEQGKLTNEQTTKNIIALLQRLFETTQQLKAKQ